MPHTEHHRTHRTGWLRASILGANDGILSTSSLMLGVAAAASPHNSIVLSGVAGLVAGAVSMAAGEYVSVKSQADTEKADLALEADEIRKNPIHETEELAGIYQERGLDIDLAREVARQMMEHDALGAHARDEIGITDALSARPIQAAVASAGTFAVGAAVPVAAASLVTAETILWLIPFVTVILLAVLGGLGSRAGGAPVWVGAMRVCLWGTLAMALTFGVGKLFGVAM